MRVGVDCLTWGVLRQSWYTALATGFCLAQVGEFSFVLAAVAKDVRTIDQHTFNLMVSSTIVTLLITPYLVTLAPRIARWISARHSEGPLAPLDRAFSSAGFVAPPCAYAAASAASQPASRPALLARRRVPP